MTGNLARWNVLGETLNGRDDATIFPPRGCESSARASDGLATPQWRQVMRGATDLPTFTGYVGTIGSFWRAPRAKWLAYVARCA